MNLKTFIKNWLPVFGILFMAIIAMSFWPGQSSDLDLPKKVDFNYHIRPILSQNCYVCHGNDPGSREAGLRLDNLQGATAKLKHGGSAIVPGNLKKSLLVERITSNDPDFRMPAPEAKKTLTAKEIALLKRWIKQGAKWKPHWAFVKPRMPKLPSSIKKASASDVIDYLINQKLKNNKLKSSGSATNNALIRRVSYLLTGLPPKPEEVKEYLADNSNDAYENMIDHFIASPAYGERWARHWMDLVRYAESMGHESDPSISSSWQYRDYLIRAFNQDVPYDLFVKEHLAGDMLENPRSNPDKEFNESIIGTGYMFLGDGKDAPVDIKAEEADKIDNMIDVTSKTFQALTVACARCHDHKFDAIPTADYYSMYGMIESSRLVPKPARKPIDQPVMVERLKVLKRTIKDHLGNRLAEELEPKISSEQASKIEEFLENKLNPDVAAEDMSTRILADFRQGDWKGWYTDGIAFGDQPAKGEISIDDESGEINELLNRFASSRVYSTGLQGVLHSPKFVIEHDSIAVRARGLNGTIRIIIDNFQIIQGPLWDKLEANVNDPDWKTYILGVGLAKGHKAYLEFLPGKFTSHVYVIQPKDYIDVKYAVAFSGDHPIRNTPLIDIIPNLSGVDRQDALQSWLNGKASPVQADVVNSMLGNLQWYSHKASLSKTLAEYSKLAGELYDPTHFIGLTEGDAIFSSVFERGSVNSQSKEKIPHRFFTAIEAGPEHFPQEGSGRLAWAESVVDLDNPLTARVMVNRIWHHLFGRGIVETVDNFGLQGRLPTHPDLLDYLAIRFMEDNWSIKGMIKQILLSETFCRSTIATEESQLKDPDNYYLHHFPVRRLEVEAIRDGILAVSGCLDPQMYGEGVPVHLGPFMTGRGIPQISGPVDSYGRRSIYMTVRRNFIPPMMLTFDMPIPFSTFGKRNTTNVPAQSLVLLNDPFVHEQAYYWAEALLKFKKRNMIGRINEIYLRAFSREARPQEIEKALLFLENQAKEYGSSLEELKDDVDLWKDYCHSVINLKEFIHLL